MAPSLSWGNENKNAAAEEEVKTKHLMEQPVTQSGPKEQLSASDGNNRRRSPVKTCKYLLF